MTASYSLVGSITQPNIASSVDGLCFDDTGLWVYCAGSDAIATPYLYTTDVSDPTTPLYADDFVLLAGMATPAGMDTDGDRLFISQQNTIREYDISTRSAPTYTGILTGPTASLDYQAMHCPGDGYLYVVTDISGANPTRLRIFDLATNLLVGQWISTSFAISPSHGVRVVGDVCFLSWTSATAHYWATIDVSNRAAPTLVDDRTGASLLNCHSAHDGTVALVQTGSPTDEAAIDLTSTSLPNLGTITPSPALQGRGNWWDSGYVIHPGRGIYDVRDPANPTVACYAVGSFNQDWAMDYHPGRKLTATSRNANTARLDIGEVVLGPAIIGTWAWKGLA